LALFFMVGSALFAAGAASGISRSGIAASGRIFFVGSLFFTTAAYLHLLEVVNEPDALTRKRPHASLWRWEYRKIGWWAAFIQLVGTLLFNVSTFEAMRALDPAREGSLVWAPDAIGSACFLTASYLAYAEASQSWAGWQPRSISWWVVSINLLGSVAFGASAVASRVALQTGQPLDPFAANLSTLIGAICFFVAAYLLLPEMTANSAGTRELRGSA
jgi:hypothetical protein